MILEITVNKVKSDITFFFCEKVISEHVKTAKESCLLLYHHEK